MGLYSFQRQFVPKIKSGQKRHTIRAPRKYEDKPGDTAYLYTGLRTKHSQHIFDAPYLKNDHIVIEPVSGLIEVAGVKLDWDEKESLAIADGFDGLFEMMAFWIDFRTFEGKIHYWDFERRVPQDLESAVLPTLVQ